MSRGLVMRDTCSNCGGFSPCVFLPKAAPMGVYLCVDCVKNASHDLDIYAECSRRGS